MHPSAGSKDTIPSQSIVPTTDNRRTFDFPDLSRSLPVISGTAVVDGPTRNTLAASAAAAFAVGVVAMGLRALRFRRDLNQFSAAEEMTAEVAADQAASAPPVDTQPPPPPTPDAAKYERGHWFYRLTFPSRTGSTTRWFPSSRYSDPELEAMAPLRAQWNANLHLQGLPHSAVAAVVAAVAGHSVESTLNVHLLHCAFRDASTRVAPSGASTLPKQPLAGC